MGKTVKKNLSSKEKLQLCISITVFVVAVIIGICQPYRLILGGITPLFFCFAIPGAVACYSIGYLLFRNESTDIDVFKGEVFLGTIFFAYGFSIFWWFYEEYKFENRQPQEYIYRITTLRKIDWTGKSYKGAFYIPEISKYVIRLSISRYHYIGEAVLIRFGTVSKKVELLRFNPDADIRYYYQHDVRYFDDDEIGNDYYYYAKLRPELSLKNFGLNIVTVPCGDNVLYYHNINDSIDSKFHECPDSLQTLENHDKLGSSWYAFYFHGEIVPKEQVFEEVPPAKEYYEKYCGKSE